MKILVINNLSAGYGDGAIYDFIRCLSDDGYEFTIRCTDGTTDLRKFLNDAKNFDIVIAAGGDGTVSTVSYVLANTRIPILPFPSGSANLVALNLFLPTENHALAKIVKSMKTMDFDIAEITKADGTNKHRYGFSGLAGAGYMAYLSKEVMQTKNHLGPWSYVGAAIANMKPTHSKINLTLDGKVIKTEGIGIIIMNFSKIGMDIKVTHSNRPKDGMLDIIVLKAKSSADYIPALTYATLDKAIDFPDRTDAVEIYKASSVKIDADPQMDFQIDSEAVDLKTPLEINVLPGGARYIVNETCLKSYE